MNIFRCETRDCPQYLKRALALETRIRCPFCDKSMTYEGTSLRERFEWLFNKDKHE